MSEEKDYFDVRVEAEKPGRFACTIPPMDVSLDEATVIDYGLRDALEGFALALLGKYSVVNGRKPVGIRFHAITFDFLLE